MNDSSSRGKLLLAILIWAMGIAALSSFLLGPQHNHHDLTSHGDCPACHWQVSAFSLVHEEIVLLSVAAIAFLPLVCVRTPVRPRAVGLLSIRAPPDSSA